MPRMSSFNRLAARVTPLLRTLALAAVVCAFGAPRPAQAQVATLGPEIVQRDAITPGDKAAIAAFVDTYRDRLSGADPIAIKNARAALIAPLQDLKATATFRINYGSAILDLLRKLLKEGKEIHQINALRIAGEVATPAALSLLKDGLADNKPGVRYAAAYGYARAFESVERTVKAGSSPAADPVNLKRAVADLRDQFDKETDTKVMDGIVLAFGATVKIPDALGQPGDSVRAESVKLMGESSIKRIKTLTPGGAAALDQIPVMLRMALPMREAVTQLAGQFRNLKDFADSIKAVLGFGQELMTLSDALTKNPGDPAVPAELITQLKKAGEPIVNLAK